jgi:hypothetical protein
MPLEEALRYRTGPLIPRCAWKFFVATENEEAGPFPWNGEVIYFEADQRILPHPFDFHAEGGVPVQVPAVEVDMNGNDVRLIVLRAGEASDARRGKQCPALPVGQLLNDHGEASDRTGL